MSFPIVTIEEGQLKGKICKDYKGGNFISFRGIPYGKPPVGDLRFKAPQPVDHWDGIRDATKEGKECPYYHLLYESIVGSEAECLNLNVFTKELPKDKSQLKPVMVWIHGGGFVQGSNKTDIYGPEYLMTEEITLVTINYRIGIFGFLSCKDPKLEIPGNVGMKDMVLALKWVQRNIKNFGGDPSNVTIFGESAGGAAVNYLLISSMTVGLFHKAIIQSGCSLNGWAQVEPNTKRVGFYLGYNENNEAKIVDKLKKESVKNILLSLNKFDDQFYGSSMRLFAPVVEKLTNQPVFLSENPLDLMKQGKFHRIPIIIGYNTLEGALWEFFRKLKPRTVSTDCEVEVPYVLNLKMGSPKSKEIANRIKKFYFGNEIPTEDNIEITYNVNGDVIVVSGIHRTIYHLADSSNQPVYVYRSNINGNLNLFKKITFSNWFMPYLILIFLSSKFDINSYFRSFFLALASKISIKDIPGCCHGDELGYLFQQEFSPKIVENSCEDIYIRRFVKLWTNFAKYGNPTQNKEKETVLNGLKWEEWDNTQRKYLDIDKELEMKQNPDRERVEFWKNIFDEFGCY